VNRGCITGFTDNQELIDLKPNEIKEGQTLLKRSLATIYKVALA
jgi:hypothetical protein